MVDAADGVTEAVEASSGGMMSQVFTWMVILMLIWVAFQMLQGPLSGFLKTRRSRGNAAVLLGQCGAGKTALFYQLRDRVEVQSVSSLKQNRDKLQIKTGEGEEDVLGPIEVVDCPGHQRLRGQAVELVKEARCIVYMVDSEDKQKLKDVAEHLYELFTMKEIIELHIPMLLAYNKCDIATARAEKFITEEIEREIEQMRVSRAATLEGQDSADSYLGVDGEKFKLLEHAPCPVEICRISAKKVELQPVFDFLRQQFSS